MYNLKIIKSNNRVEIYRYNNYVVGSKGEEHIGEVFKDNQGRRGKDTIEEDIKTDNKDRARATTLNNARNNIIRLIKANEDMQTFITLTFAKENNYKDSKKLLDKLFHKLRRDYPGLKYLWVLEYGTLNSRLHYHMLCSIPINIKLNGSNERKSKEHKQLENEFRLKYWNFDSCGWVDIRHLIQEGNTNIALYVATYVNKGLMELQELEGYRIYGYSIKTLNKPITTTEYTTESLEKLIEGFKGNYDITYSNSYEIGYTTDKGNYKGTVLYMDLMQKED